jgi:hypothetical protein
MNTNPSLFDRGPQGLAPRGSRVSGSGAHLDLMSVSWDFEIQLRNLAAHPRRMVHASPPCRRFPQLLFRVRPRAPALRGRQPAQ